jgi:hypothetical protein
VADGVYHDMVRVPVRSPVAHWSRLDGPGGEVTRHVPGRGRRLTSWPSLWTDLRNAGAEPVDQEVVVDGPFTTSRSPVDLPAFCPAIIVGFASTRATR